MLMITCCKCSTCLPVLFVHWTLTCIFTSKSLLTLSQQFECFKWPFLNDPKRHPFAYCADHTVGKHLQNAFCQDTAKCMVMRLLQVIRYQIDIPFKLLKQVQIFLCNWMKTPKGFLKPLTIGPLNNTDLIVDDSDVID